MNRIVAVNSNCYHGYSIEEAIDGISAAGFSYIELTATKGWTEHVFPSMSLSYLAQVKQRCADKKITPIALSGHCNLMDAHRIPDFIDNMRLANFFGCQYIVSSIGEAHLDNDVVATDAETAKRLEALIPHLETYNLTLVLEVHGQEHGTGQKIKAIVDQIQSDRIGINYDTANAIFFGNANVMEDMEACIDQIQYMHIKDKAGAVTEWNFPALGQGTIDFLKIKEKLDAVNNLSPFSVEIEFTKAGPKDLQEINEAVATSYTYLKSIGLHV